MRNWASALQIKYLYIDMCVYYDSINVMCVIM